MMLKNLLSSELRRRESDDEGSRRLCTMGTYVSNYTPSYSTGQ